MVPISADDGELDRTSAALAATILNAPITVVKEGWILLAVS